MFNQIYKKSALVRRSWRIWRQVPRRVQRIRVKPSDYLERPPIVANSIPKSGTHLLNQILKALSSQEFGTFITSIPSVPYRVQPKGRMGAALQRILPGELVSAHVFFDEDYHCFLRAKNAVHFFIYRDPRDVAISEAHYLTSINRWHNLHPYFKALSTEEERIELAISGREAAGFPYDYPDIAARYRSYLGWLKQEGVMAVRFEDLRSDRSLSVIQEMIRFYATRLQSGVDVEELTSRALSHIDPDKSFTYRSGRVGRWQSTLTDRHREQVKAVAGELLIELGYERDLDW